MPHRKLLVLDFDGVLHSYTSGWQGAEVVSDPPVPGAMQALAAYTEVFRVAVYSSRSKAEGGVAAMRHWLTHNLFGALGGAEGGRVLQAIEWPTSKPPAFVTLDDRALTFTGTWPSSQDLAAFEPWNKRRPQTSLDRDLAWSALTEAMRIAETAIYGGLPNDRHVRAVLSQLDVLGFDLVRRT